VLAQAATGTGKTAAFALPLLHRLTPDAPPRERTAALVLVPTRELAMQVAEAIRKYGAGIGAVAVPIYGGTPMESQIRTLKRGADVVIATPGRALDHIRRKTIFLGSLRTVVLDEADEMLDMGFAEDLEAILAATPAEKQVALFSATLAPRIATIARTHLRDPEVIEVDTAAVKAARTATIRQVTYLVARAYKMPALARILDIERPTSAIVFCRTRTEVDALTETLTGRGLPAEALHGGLSQEQRDRVMKRFRAKTSTLLVATDVAARGLDVQHVSHVVNFDVPNATEAYVHRIGRTGRAGRAGVAITLMEPREQRWLRSFERATGQPITVQPIPSVADLRASRAAAAQEALRAVIVAGELAPWRAIVDALAVEFAPAEIAAAALRQAMGEVDSVAEEEIPDARERHPAREREAVRKARREAKGSAADGVAAGSVERSPARPATHPSRAATASRPPRTTAKRKGAGPAGAMAKLYLGAGRKLKIRPGDIVGAITNEMGMDASAIGAIQIWDRHSIVEVPDSVADEVIATLSATTIKGKRVQVRRDRSVR
jgi:ATP-dependent RNA helicase DeaD